MYDYNWTLRDANFAGDAGKVFSCFSCGGGSSMGYKLAGFDVVGCCEIDPRMMAAYQANLHPRLAYCEDIREFAAREDLPAELYQLDILDGSPPCSTFSMAGQREKTWGVEKRFREGQAKQVLDTLFFDFIALAAKLRPKIVIAENVKGIICGKAKAYADRVMDELGKAGYKAVRALLDAKRMGVPQTRQRVFFLAVRADLAEPLCEGGELRIDLGYDDPVIPFSEVMTQECDRPLKGKKLEGWEMRKPGDKDIGTSVGNPNYMFSQKYIYGHKAANTITGGDQCVLFDAPRHRNRAEVLACSSWPTDYDFAGQSPRYLCGMSVPPVMMARVAAEVRRQWLDKIRAL